MRVMAFIDGTWLSQSWQNSFEEENTEFDYRGFPGFLINKVSELFEISADNVDMVRCFFFTNYPENFDPEDSDMAERFMKFQDDLRRDGYEVLAFPLDYRGRRLRKKERPLEDDFLPREKRVDVALVTSLLCNAVVPGVYDIAVVVTGDDDFVPALQGVRNLGKRVMLVSIRRVCAAAYRNLIDRLGVRDVPTVFLEDSLEELSLSTALVELVCNHPDHEGPRTFRADLKTARKGITFCEVCRMKHWQARQRLGQENISTLLGALGSERYKLLTSNRRLGVVDRVFFERGFGFILDEEMLSSEEPRLLYFHASFLNKETDWRDIKAGMVVEFTPALTERGKQAKGVVLVEI